MYVKDCCTSCSDTHAVVKEFKESKLLIAKISKQIGSSLLLRIDKNQIYEGIGDVKFLLFFKMIDRC
jgi:hypothetical protein